MRMVVSVRMIVAMSMVLVLVVSFAVGMSMRTGQSVHVSVTAIVPAVLHGGVPGALRGHRIPAPPCDSK